MQSLIALAEICRWMLQSIHIPQRFHVRLIQACFWSKIHNHTAITEAGLSAPARLQCRKAPFNWRSVPSVVRMERSREEGTECERAWTPLLLFRWPVDGDGVQCFLKWPPADKHVPFPAQLSVSDIEPDQGKYLPPLPVFSFKFNDKKNQCEEYEECDFS